MCQISSTATTTTTAPAAIITTSPSSSASSSTLPPMIEQLLAKLLWPSSSTSSSSLSLIKQSTMSLYIYCQQFMAKMFEIVYKLNYHCLNDDEINKKSTTKLNKQSNQRVKNLKNSKNFKNSKHSKNFKLKNNYNNQYNANNNDDNGDHRRVNIVKSILIISTLCLICYSNSLNGDFIHDDIPAIVHNNDVHGLTSLKQLFQNDYWGKSMYDYDSHKSYRPITILTFRLNMMISTKSFGFHLANSILHTINSCLVYWIALRIMRLEQKFSLIAGIMFAIHPIHCEAVTSIVGRADLLCGLFYLLAFIAFHASLPSHDDDHRLRKPQQRNPQQQQLRLNQQQSLIRSSIWLLLFTLSTILALLSKEIGITIIGVCAFYLLSLLLSSVSLSASSSSLFNNNYKYKLQIFITIFVIIFNFLTLMIFRLKMLGNNWPIFSEQDNPASYSKSLMTRILTYFYIATYNIYLLICPLYQSYDWQTSTIRLIDQLNDIRNLYTLTTLLIIASLLYRSIKNLFTTNDDNNNSNSNTNNRILFLSITMTIIPYLPASNLFITVGFVIAERLLYVPSIGFIYLICYGLQQLQQQQCSNRRPSPPASLFHIFNDNFINKSFKILAIILIVKTIKQNDVWTSKETLYKSAIINVPDNAKAHYNYGNYLQQQQNLNDAIEHYKIAIRLWPKYASAHNNLGTLYYRLSIMSKAEKHFESAIAINPYHAKAYFNLAKLYSKRGQLIKAKKLVEHSIYLDQKFADSYEALATIYSNLSPTDSALINIERINDNDNDNDNDDNYYDAYYSDINDNSNESINNGHQLIAERLYLFALKRSHCFRMNNNFRLNHHDNDNYNYNYKCIDFLNNYGVHLQRQRRTKMSLLIYNYAIKLSNYKHKIALLNMANLLQSMKHYDGAEYFFKRAMKLRQDVRTLDSLAIFYMQRSKLRLARNIYQRLLYPPLPSSDQSTIAQDINNDNANNGNNNQNSINNADDNNDHNYHHNHHQMIQLNMVNIHYAQLLILEGKYDQAEWILETLILMISSSTSSMKSNMESNVNNFEDDGRQRMIEYLIGSPSLSSSTTYSMQSNNVNIDNDHHINGNGYNVDDHNHYHYHHHHHHHHHQQQQKQIFHFDLYHQLALLFTITNRTDKALLTINDSIRLLCKNDDRLIESIDGNVAATVDDNDDEDDINDLAYISMQSLPMLSMMTTQKKLITNRCSKIYTLKGDIEKDFELWHDAEQSYRIAIEFDDNQLRAHLNLAVIYHLHSRFIDAIHHYKRAKQLDRFGMNHQLIDDNIRKLLRNIQKLNLNLHINDDDHDNYQRYHQKQYEFECHHKCQTSATSTKTSSMIINNQNYLSILNQSNDNHENNNDDDGHNNNNNNNKVKNRWNSIETSFDFNDDHNNDNNENNNMNNIIRHKHRISIIGNDNEHHHHHHDHQLKRRQQQQQQQPSLSFFTSY